MVKTMLALAVLFGLLPQEAHVNPKITIDPVPPTQGESVTITYDGPLPASLTIEWEDEDGDVTEQKVKISGPAGVKVTVPDNAEAMKVTDDAGLAFAAVTQIDPA